MVFNFPKATPRFCLHHRRFTKEDGWVVWHLSLSPSGSIAVSGGNEKTDNTLIDVYKFRNSNTKDKPKLYCSKEFEKYEDEEWIYRRRLVAFVESDDDGLVTCIGDKLEVMQMNTCEVLRCRKVNGLAYSLSVRQMEMFISFYQANKITVYDVTNLNEIRSIVLHEILDRNFIPDMTAISTSIYVRTWNGDAEKQRALELDEDSGRILSEFTNPSCNPTYVWSVTVSVSLGVVAVVSSDSVAIGEGVDQIVFYSLVDTNKSSFLSVKVESDLYRVRMSERDDGMIAGIQVTGEVKMYYMNELFHYRLLKEIMVSNLTKEDCKKLSEYFSLSKGQIETIVKSDTPTESLFLVLEGKGVLLPSNVHRMIEALKNLKIESFCHHVIEVYQKTRTDSASYDRILSTLPAHLVASVPNDLCDYFSFPEKKKEIISSSQNPGLSLMTSLDEMGIIKSSDVEALEKPFTELGLVQAAAKIGEYQSRGEEENLPSQDHTGLSLEEIECLFIEYLQKKIKRCYETMSPVPWKNSCKWRAADLFIKTTLILTVSKAKGSGIPQNEQCELFYDEIFSHERLKTETRIILEGDPGSGKTMLMYHLAYQWSQGKFGNIKFLVLLPLNVVKGKALSQAIKDFYLPDDDCLTLPDIEMLLLRTENSTCFLLDGLEEYSDALTEGAQSDVGKFMLKQKYPTCKAVISTRSHNTHNLPQYPVLKLGKFHNMERNAYIQKVFPDNLAKQTDAKTLTIDNQLVNDLCSLVLLFVMVVHKIENTRELQNAKSHRVAPVVKHVVDAFCPTGDEGSQKEGSTTPSRDEKDKEILGQLAYNGLCTEKQQLQWQKEFIESKLANSKNWIDSGILVMEEIIADIHRPRDRSMANLLDGKGTNIHDLNVKEKENIKPSPVKMEAEAVLRTHTDTELKSFTERNDSEVQVGNSERCPMASGLPLQVKFFHTIIQEWFAASYVSSYVIPKFRNSYFLQGHLKSNLLLINPFDLQYVLRFAVALCAPCCHIVMKHLLNKYRTNNGDIPKDVMNYIFLCFAEYDGEHRHGILEAVAQIFKEDIVINPEEGRAVQQAKVDMLELASNCGIVLRKLCLDDVVESVNEDGMQFNSGVMLRVLHTVETLEINNHDNRLTPEDGKNIVKFIDRCFWIKEARLNLPEQPPRVDEETGTRLQESGKTVIWTKSTQLSHAQNTRTEEPTVKSPNEVLMSKATVYFGWDERTALEVKHTMSARGGSIKIPHTGVQLDIPAGALPAGIEECDICLRIIPADFSDFSTDGYSSNSSVIVELLPSNINFHLPCRLTLPHCLYLKEGTDYKASTFMSHHKEGTYPLWEEQTNMACELTDTACTIMLQTFCWVKCVIEDTIVEAQRIQVYAAGRHIMPLQRAYEIEVGYFPDMPGGGEKLRSNKKVHIISKRGFLVYKEGKEPLRLFFEEIVPNEWNIIQDGERAKEIPFEFIDLSKERSCSFRFVNYSQDPLIPLFKFRAVQGDRGVCLRYRAKERNDVSKGTQTD